MPTQLESYNDDKLEPVMAPELAKIDAATLGPSLTLAKGTVLGRKTVDGLLYAYVGANVDGTGTAVAILIHDVATDAGGKHYFSDSAVASRMNLPKENTAVYYAGVFDTVDLTGYDAAALVDLNGRVLHNGYIKF